MEPFTIERLVYDGSDPSDDYVVIGIGHSKLNLANVKTIPVGSLTEYEAACTIHTDKDRCQGHMGKTASGLHLPASSLIVHTATVSNDVWNAAFWAFNGTDDYSRERYRTTLLESMKKKTGRMRRGILNCHVDGSLRMIIRPHLTQPIDNREVLCIPYYLHGIWKVCRLDYATNKYITLPVEDGDSCIVVRPPGLTGKSNQALKIKFWKSECLGINQKVLKALFGDYDGDEIHAFPIYSRAAIEEWTRWQTTPNPTIDLAEALYQESGLADPNALNNEFGMRDEFMMHTTISFKQIMDGKAGPIMANQTRTKDGHIDQMRYRMNNPEEMFKKFFAESVKGMGDVNRQQLSQPIVGDMSRIARICASCVHQMSDGTIGIFALNGFVPIKRSVYDDSEGSAAVRIISIICAEAQQAYLESHHKKVNSEVSHNMIEDLEVGSEYTMVVYENIDDARSIDASFKYRKGDHIYAWIKPSSVSSRHALKIVAAYSPVVLALIPLWKQYTVCRSGIQVVAIYHEIAMSDIELTSMAVLYTYRVNVPGTCICKGRDNPHPVYKHPITTREGMEARQLHWIETTMATHYSSLRNKLRVSDMPISTVKTVSAALMGANFIDVLEDRCK
jgi:hypothetical protein